MLTEEQCKDLALAFYGRYADYYQDAHITVKELLPQLAILLGEVDAMVIERCALLCDAIAEDKHAQFKGRAPHAPNNDHRADTFTEGESSGAELCAAAIRAR